MGLAQRRAASELSIAGATNLPSPAPAIPAARADSPTDTARWQFGPTKRFGLLAGLGLLFYVIHEQTQFEQVPGQLSAEIPVLPIPNMVWYTGCWFLFAALLVLLFRTGGKDIPEDDRSIRRLALLVAAAAYGIELGVRWAVTGFFGWEQRIPPATLAIGATASAAILGVLLRWPPRRPVLIALLLGSGLLVRAVWFFLVTPTPQHSDNLFVIRMGWERLIAGQTPYAYFDFGTHTNPMPYLPWTFLSYGPSFLAGLDLRVTSFVFSLLLIAAFGWIFRQLPVTADTRSRLMLVLAVFYTLPISVSLDEHTEFGWFHLMLILTFAFVALGRWRWSAIAYGFALGSMPVALFCAPCLLAYACRRFTWRQVAEIFLIVTAVSATPVLFFLAWDAHAFWWAVSYVPREAWASLDNGEWVYPSFTPIVWHHLGGNLRFLQIGFFLTFAAIASVRLRTVLGLIGLAACSHLFMVLSGPYVGPHLLQIVLYLAVLGEVVNWARIERTNG